MNKSSFLGVMLREFWGAWLVSVLALVAAYFIGAKNGSSGAWTAVIAVLILGLFEVSISFDNAVVNAMVLKKQSEAFRMAFLTIGFLIGVIGMRLLLPLVIVALTTGLGLGQVYDMAVNNPDEYSHQLHLHHVEVMLFGGAFLMMVELTWLFDNERDIHWLGGFERRLGALGKLSMLAAGVSLMCVLAVVLSEDEAHRYPALLAGTLGVVIYILVGGLGDALADEDTEGALDVGDLVKKGFSAAVATFLFLEVRDASFSFDGVIGAFAITNDVIIIMLGLAIGAMFVRSMTIFLVEKGTLDEFVYLEHGAHYAIGALAVIMLLATVHIEVPEIVTGLIGIAFIVWAVINSISYRKREEALAKH